MQFEKMTLDKEEGVAILSLNYPEKMNALTSAMWMDLRKVIETVRGDETIKVLVITGTGRAFCSGFPGGDSGGCYQSCPNDSLLYAGGMNSGVLLLGYT